MYTTHMRGGQEKSRPYNDVGTSHPQISVASGQPSEQFGMRVEHARTGGRNPAT